jgi:hypothetical protein
MELSQYVEMLRGELTALTRFAGEDVRRTAGLLAESLDSPVRLTLLDVLSAAAAEITARLDETVVEVRLSDGEPAFVVSTALPRDSGAPPGPEPAESAEDTGTARVTLRLSESLKGAIEAAATSDGVSVNTWLIRAASRTLEAQSRGGQPGSRRGPGQRITGFARS